MFPGFHEWPSPRKFSKCPCFILFKKSKSRIEIRVLSVVLEIVFFKGKLVDRWVFYLKYGDDELMNWNQLMRTLVTRDVNHR